MASWPLVPADFSAYFVREFVYGGTSDTVMPADVARALTEAGLIFKTALWANQTEMQTAYLYAAAHFLTLNIQGAGGLAVVNSGRGISSGGGGVIESKSVGGVSVSYALPDMVRNNPILSQFMRTDFGQKYLMFIMPRLVGNVMLVSGNPDVSSMDPARTSGIGFGGAVIEPLVITTTLMPAGVQSVVYSQKLDSTGGVGPLSWSVSDGTKPDGLALDPVSGYLSGTPTTVGTYYFTVMVTDARGASATQNYQVVIS